MTSYHLRPAELRDCYKLARTLRDGDRMEVTGLGLTAAAALRSCWRGAILRRTAIVDGSIAAMWGMTGAMLSDTGYPFLMTGPAIERVPISFVKEARKGIAEMLRLRSRLKTCVSAEYNMACRFLHLLGFELSEPERIGPHGALYRRATLAARGTETLH